MKTLNLIEALEKMGGLDKFNDGHFGGFGEEVSKESSFTIEEISGQVESQWEELPRYPKKWLLDTLKNNIEW